MDIEINDLPFPHFSYQFLGKKDAVVLKEEILQSARDQNNLFREGSLGRINALHGSAEQRELLSRCPETVKVIKQISEALPSSIIKAYSGCSDFPDLTKHNLFTRVDISVARDGYSRPAHLDREYHLAINFLYLSGKDDYGGSGGELKLMQPVIGSPPTTGDKFPDESSLADGVVIKPQAGLLAGFLRTNNSWHTVNPMAGNQGERVFIFFGVDSDRDIWDGCFVESEQRRAYFLST